MNKLFTQLYHSYIVQFLFLTVCIALLAPRTIIAQGWERPYGGANDDIAYCVIETSDSNFLVAGTTKSFGVTGIDVYILKLDKVGHLIWSRTIGGLNDDVAYAVIESNTGDYYITGSTNSFGMGNEDVYLVKMDVNGNVIWEQTYGGFDKDYAQSLQETSDSNIIVAGYTASFGSGNGDAYMIKIDTAGFAIWSKTYGGSMYDEAIYVETVSDNGFIFTGKTLSYGNKYAYVVKTDFNGDTLWARAYNFGSESSYNYGKTIREMPTNNNFLVYGTEGTSFPEYYFWRIDSMGVITNLGAQHPSNCNSAITMDLTSDGGNVILCNECVYGRTLIKFPNYGGSFSWYKTFGNLTGGTDIKQTSDGGYLVAGYTKAVGNGNKDAYIIKTDSIGNTWRNNISGKIIFDSNKNCGTNTGLPESIIKATSSTSGAMNYARSDDNGNYNIPVDIGTWTITHKANNYMTVNCPQSGYHIVTFTNPFTNSPGKHFYDTTIYDAAILSVHIASGIQRRCQSNNKYFVSYYNLGNVTAYNVQIIVTLDDGIFPISSSILWTSQTGQVLTFDFDSVRPFTSGTFYIVDSVTCDPAMIGRTKCAEATIYPDTILEPIDSTWDKSSVTVGGSCLNNDTIRFVIYNTGDPGIGDMAGPSEFRIYQNNILITTNIFQLNGGDSLIIKIPADSSTYRMEADQRPGHPGNSFPRVTIETCGTGNLVLGLINSVFHNDQDLYKSITCQELRTAWDPNDKQVVPIGFTDENYITPFDDLEYTVRFQNTGNDTAFTVILRDTLSQYLDPLTLEIQASSHNYVWDIYDNGILEFVFNNINLVDSTTNEPESHGFIQFRINQKNNPLGTVVENKACIYFDYNAPVITNKTTNTVFSCDSIANFTVNNLILCVGDTLFFTYNNGGADSLLWFLNGDTIDTSSNSFVKLDSIGSYNLTLIAGNQVCSDTNSKIINTYPPPVANAGLDTAICFKDSASLSASGGFVYSWSPSVGLSNPNISNPLASPDTNITYIVNVSIGSCYDSDTITVLINSLPADIATTTNVSCNNGSDGSANLTISDGLPPYSYNWSTGDTTEDLSGISAGSYTITVTDSNNCKTYDTIAINEPLAITDSVIISNVNCNGGANGFAELTVSGGIMPYSYMWSNGDTTEDILGLYAGVYFLSITDSNGCIIFDSISVAEPPALNTSITGIDVSCNGGNNGSADLTVSGGILPYTYNWSSGDTTEDISGLLIGTYSVIITDSNVCSAFDTIIITEPAMLTANIMAVNITCNGYSDGVADLTVTGGVQPYIFTWSTGDSTEDLSGLIPGTYSVVVIDSNGCTISDSVSITEPLTLTTTITTTNVSCNGNSDGTSDLTVTGGTSPYTYYWSNGITTEDVTNLNAGTYYVSVTDSNGCIKNDTAIVSEPADLFSIMSGTNVSCNNGNDGAIDLMVVGGTQPYTYLWSNGDTVEDPTGLISGIYLVTINDVNGCSKVDGIVLTEPSAIITSVSVNDANCSGASDGSASISSGGGIFPYTYLWSSGGIGSTEAGLSAGDYTVTVTDFNGCIKMDSMTIGEPPPISISSELSTNVIGCSGDTNGTITIAATGGTGTLSYSIDGGSAYPNNTGFFAWLAAGNYEVMAIDSNGCTQQGSIITITEPPLIQNSASVTICDNDSIFLQGTHQRTPGTYYDTLIAINGCDSIMATTLTVNPLPVVSISGLDTTYCATDAGVTMTGIPDGGEFTGTGGVAGNQFVPSTGVNSYSVTYSYTDSLGCSNSVSQSVNVVQCTGIPEDERTSQIKVYPNPTGSKFTVEIPGISEPENPYEITVYDILGRVIKQIEAKSKRLEVDISKHPAGLYFIQLRNENTLYNARIVKP